MKIIKVLAVVILLIIASALILAAVTKKEYSVTRSIEINKPVTVVFNYVKYLKNQNDYSVWAKIDPNMKKEYKGTDATPGFISSWDSEKEEAGAGEQEIKSIVPNEKIDYEIRFRKPFKSTSNATMQFAAIDSTKTNVTWAFDGKMNYPMNILLVFMDMDKEIGKDLAGGLSNLKVIMEK